MTDNTTPHFQPADQLTSRPVAVDDLVTLDVSRRTIRTALDGRVLTDAERFVRRLVLTDPEGCWGLDLFHDGHGYPRFQVGRRSRKASRFAYELMVGPIPDGFVIDHLCRNRGCVNPAHLEAVTQAENVRRGEATNGDHCKRGHEYTPENTRYTGAGYRTCKQCVRLAQRARQAAARQERREVAS